LCACWSARTVAVNLIPKYPDKAAARAIQTVFPPPAMPDAVTFDGPEMWITYQTLKTISVR